MQIFKKLWAFAHELGGVYYLWWALSALGGALYAAYKQLTDPNLSQIFFFGFVFLSVVVIALVPILFFALVRKGLRTDGHTLSNPNLIMLERKVTYTIGKTGLKKLQSFRFKASKRASYYHFSMMVTGTATSKVTLLTNTVGTLAGPAKRRAASVYQVVFSRPLEKGEIIDFQVEIEVFDPNSTMSTFVSDSFTNCYDYGSFEAIYIFNQQPQAVNREVASCVTDTPLESIQPLLPQNGTGTYCYTVDKVVSNAAYTVSWLW